MVRSHACHSPSVAPGIGPASRERAESPAGRYRRRPPSRGAGDPSHTERAEGGTCGNPRPIACRREHHVAWPRPSLFFYQRLAVPVAFQLRYGNAAGTAIDSWCRGHRGEPHISRMPRLGPPLSNASRLIGGSTQGFPILRAVATRQLPRFFPHDTLWLEGEVTEWSIVRHWKCRVRVKLHRGFESHPLRSGDGLRLQRPI